MIKVIGAPAYTKPMNAQGGLYMVVRYSTDTPDKELHEFVKATAQAYGYDPDGRADMGGFPSPYGIGTVERYVWFYDIIFFTTTED